MVTSEAAGLRMFDMHSLVLPDGAEVQVRQIEAGDAPALHRFHHGLSADSIYLRHFHSLPELSSGQEVYFTQVDGKYRLALIALDPTAPMLCRTRADRHASAKARLVFGPG